MKAGETRGGLAGTILRVDLSTGVIRKEETARYAGEWIGGRAINSRILLDEVGRQTTWSDPENLLIFGAGALAGIAPGGSRLSVDTKNVFSGGKGSANVGGHFAPELKFAGYDHVVISGRAEKPVYLWIFDDKVEIRDARFLWGKTTFETEAALQQELGNDRVRVACIGPAGERLVRGSLILVDRAKAAGGSGVGCVMGSKNLKAVAVRGTGRLGIVRPDDFAGAMATAMRKVEESPTTAPMQDKTLAGVYYTDEHNPSWDLLFVARNGQDDYWEIEKRKRLMNAATGAPRFRKKVLACSNCPAGCMPFSQIDDGPYKGTSGEGFWVNTIMSATMLDITDPEAMIAAWLRMNELGLDDDFATGMSAWAYECFEKGLLTENDTDSLSLTWGNGDAFVSLLGKIAYREGIGDLLARGPIEAAQMVGGGSDYFAINVKGQPSIEPFRVPKGWGLGVATSPVAGRHLRGSILGSGRFGPKGSVFEPQTYEDKARYVTWQGLTKEIEDLAGICVYVGTWSGAHALEVSDYAALLDSALGLDLDEKELMRIARRSRALEKSFNSLHTDMGREDDLPPRRYMEESVKSGPFKGHRCEPDKWGRMLDDYYEFQGWDRRTGLQRKSTLESLGMDDVARRLAVAGKLADRGPER
jgi:aldehyde:ferredoxin oxidoreductase